MSIQIVWAAILESIAYSCLRVARWQTRLAGKCKDACFVREMSAEYRWLQYHRKLHLARKQTALDKLEDT